MFVSWQDEKHSIQIPEIDKHHKELFALTNQLFILRENTQKQQVYLILKRLYAYVKYHFSAEEALFRQYGYEGSTGHKLRHEEFAKHIRDWLDDCKEDRPQNMEEILDFLVNWILVHIQKDDVQYAWDFQKRGINPQLFFKPSNNASSGSTTEADALATWEENKLGLDLKDIDQQHRELVGILQQANDLLLATKERRHVFTPVLLQKLYYYSQYHFSFEEELLARNHYPAFKEHRKLHDVFSKTLRDFAGQYTKNSAGLNEELVHFLKSWTLEHILGEDKKYKAYLEHKTS